MNKIKYLIRKRALGDVLWTEPVIRALASRYRKLVVYTKYPELFEHYPAANVQFKKELSFIERAIIVLEKKLGLHLLTLNLDDAYEKRPDMHFLHAYQQEAALPLTTEYPRLHLSPAEKELLLVKGPYAILHLESFSDKKFRQIYGVDWTAVVASLNAQGLQVVLMGTNPGDIGGTIRVKTTIREMISLICHARFFVGIDSGPSHIAASLQIPSLIFFGAIKPEYRHFPALFKGILAKKDCEYDDQQALVLSAACLDCRRSPDPAVALCSLYSTDDVLSKISQLNNHD